LIIGLVAGLILGAKDEAGIAAKVAAPVSVPGAGGADGQVLSLLREISATLRNIEAKIK
jgi:hypothetical protein